jgi:hypothetical protein
VRSPSYTQAIMCCTHGVRPGHAAQSLQNTSVCWWTMQRLDHALQQSGVAVDGRREWWDMPLLSRANGSLVFAPGPVVQDDHRLGNRLRDRRIFFEGGRSWSHLIRAISLPLACLG